MFYKNKNQTMQPVTPFPACREGMGMGQREQKVSGKKQESAAPALDDSR